MSKEYYADRVSASDDRHFQVGKTVRGQPVTNNSLKATVENIVHTLRLNDQDTIIDLGAGNGLVTELIAPHCKSVEAVDQSEELLKIAEQSLSGSLRGKIRYLQSDILRLNKGQVQGKKAYANEVLQHLKFVELAPLLTHFFHELDVKLLYVLGVPDEARKFEFYATEDDKRYYYQCLANGQSPMGTWWEQGYISFVVETLNLKVEFLEQPKQTHTAHYRFNFLVTLDG